MKGTGQSAARPLLPAAGRPLAMAIVVVCTLVTTVQGVWLRHGMETGWVDTALDAKVRASLGGHPLLLAALVWPGKPVSTAAMAAVLVLACILRRRYGEAAFVAISVPLAAALTEVVLKPLIGRTSWGDPFPSGHVTRVVALATALTVMLAMMPARVSRLLRLVLAVTAFLIAAAVAFGVIGANMHHFSDTVGGAAVGTGTVLAAALLLDLLSARLNTGASRRSLLSTVLDVSLMSRAQMPPGAACAPMPHAPRPAGGELVIDLRDNTLSNPPPVPVSIRRGLPSSANGVTRRDMRARWTAYMARLPPIGRSSRSSTSRWPGSATARSAGTQLAWTLVSQPFVVRSSTM